MLDVGGELGIALALAGGAGDEPDALGLEVADDRLDALALGAVLDAARHADVVDARHQHAEAPGQAHLLGDARALGADRLLGDLDQDLLALLEVVLDLGDRGAAAPRPVAVLLEVGDVLEVAERLGQVRGVEEAGLGQAEVDERGLHAGQDGVDAALVDVADVPALLGALHEQLGELVRPRGWRCGSRSDRR